MLRTSFFVVAISIVMSTVICGDTARQRLRVEHGATVLLDAGLEHVNSSRIEIAIVQLKRNCIVFVSCTQLVCKQQDTLAVQPTLAKYPTSVSGFPGLLHACFPQPTRC